jgi:hypothetical protein
MMMVPEAWQDNQYLSDSKKAFYEYNSCIMEPWDGPAMVRRVPPPLLPLTHPRRRLISLL